ncbi:helix-turn-helix domain-containing protein [Corallibacter sp.]|uniref:helix-turn-helix domain-containing protein n=1 Tax=Corallibacter sp. TaxID=2038084 RepID=UPI003AB752BB
MKNLEQSLFREIQKLKAFQINRLRRMEKRQIEILNQEKFENTLDDWLTEKEVEKQYKISRSTLYRYRVNEGLKAYKNDYNGKIRYKKRDVEDFLTKKGRSW